MFAVDLLPHQLTILEIGEALHLAGSTGILFNPFDLAFLVVIDPAVRFAVAVCVSLLTYGSILVVKKACHYLTPSQAAGDETHQYDKNKTLCFQTLAPDHRNFNLQDNPSCSSVS